MNARTNTWTIEETEEFLKQTDIFMAGRARDKVQFLIDKEKSDKRHARWDQEDVIQAARLCVAHESLSRSLQIGLSKNAK